MKILLLGAAGFIGRAILTELAAQGHDVVAVIRPRRGHGGVIAAARVVEIDLAKAVQPDDWRDALSGVDLVINAAGVLRGRDMDAVHVAMPCALHAAALAADVRRVVLISAISARADVLTDYARAKLAGEEVLRASGLDWTILRPSLIYGDGSYGGTSLMRGLAALPFVVPLPGKGDFAFTPLHARDLARAVRVVAEQEHYAGQVLDPVGPETMDLRALLAHYRRWLGFGEARFLPVPMPIMRGLAKLGDLLGSGPVSTNSLVQMVAGNGGDPARFASAIGFVPASLDAHLAAHPAQVQDRWHARLFFLSPALQWVLALMWLASGLLGLSHGAARTADVMAGLGWPQSLADPLRIGSSLLDFALAGLLLADRRGKWATMAQVAVVAGYTLVIGYAVPGLWLDPLGALLKNVPVLAAVLAYGAIADQH